MMAVSNKEDLNDGCDGVCKFIIAYSGKNEKEYVS